MPDLSEEINCPACGESKLASSFLTSKASGRKICVVCWKKEKAAAKEEGAEKPAPAAEAVPSAPADLSDEVACPVCGETKRASSFLTSKASGQKICVVCWKKEKAAAKEAGVGEANAAPASAAPSAPAAAVEIPAEGEIPCPQCATTVDVKKIVTSKATGAKICWRCYFKEMKAKGESKKEEKAAPEKAAAAATAEPEEEETQETARTYLRAQTVTLRPVAEPTGEQDVSRRGFVGWVILGWLAFAAAAAQGAIALTRFMFPNVLFEPPSSFKIGFPEEFEKGQVVTRFKAKYAIWVVRNDEGIYVLSTVCTHLGCTPNWLADAQKFKCPCHGSGFRRSGINFEGPAPRPLERYRIVLADDGQILVDKSVKFQQEKGQWDDPEAMLHV